MPRAGLALLAAVLVAGCGVETVVIERQPRSAFEDDPAALDAYDRGEERCSKAASLRKLAADVGTLNPRRAGPKEVAEAYGFDDDDTEIASGAYSGCLDGIEAANLD